MPTQKKIQTVERLTSDFTRAQSAAFVDYQGLSTSQLTQLRNSLKEQGGNLQIVKNTLLKIALQKENRGEFSLLALTGPTAVVFSFKDETSPLKILDKFIQSYELPKVKGGLLQGALIDAEQVLELAKLPAREILLTKLATQLNAPVSRVAYVLQTNLRNLISVLSRSHPAKGKTFVVPKGGDSK